MNLSIKTITILLETYNEMYKSYTHDCSDKQKIGDLIADLEKIVCSCGHRVIECDCAAGCKCGCRKQYLDKY